MDAETLARCIEPFFSTKGVGQGTGLGLSMVHGLAAQLSGALRIQSRPGAGTEIELWLPVTVAIEASQNGDEEKAIPLRAGVALVVDDEELVRSSTADMLNDLGYDTVEAASAEDALQVLGQQRVDLLVTDHLMPGMTGTELAQATRQRFPLLKVLIVSGYADAEGLDPSYTRLTKPFRQSELAAALRD
jgi:CheY-like chemotaxis protein